MALVSAADDPVGTLRRERGSGFAHLIKLEQGGDAPCWDLIDMYGSCGDLLGFPAGLLTNADVDGLNNEVVYTPIEDKEWARLTGDTP